MTRVTLALLFAFPAAASAQTFFGLSAGINYGGPQSALDSYTQGFAMQASLGRQLAPGVSVRVDAATSRFVATERALACPGLGRCGPPGYVQPVGLAGLTVNGVVNLTVVGVPLYLIAGTGLDYYYEHPTAQRAVRTDLSAGAGLTVPIGHIQLPLEARFHRLVDAPGALTWFVPVTLGIRF